MIISMLRDDWWWPWWVSTLIDLAVVLLATGVLVWTSRRWVKVVAGVFIVAGLVAAVMAPIVMTDDSKGPGMRDDGPMMEDR